MQDTGRFFEIPTGLPINAGNFTARALPAADLHPSRWKGSFEILNDFMQGPVRSKPEPARIKGSKGTHLICWWLRCSEFWASIWRQPLVSTSSWCRRVQEVGSEGRMEDSERNWGEGYIVQVDRQVFIWNLTLHLIISEDLTFRPIV